jgi:hypothetical protein
MPLVLESLALEPGASQRRATNQAERPEEA